MKKPFNWWTGWIVLYPFRLIFMLLASIYIAGAPSSFYEVLNHKIRNDPDDWILD